MKKELFLTLVCLFGGAVGFDAPISAAADVEAVATSGVETLIGEVEKLCADAKKECAPRYDRSVAEARVEVREKIVALDEYLRENPNDRGARLLYDELRRLGLTSVEISPPAFREGACEANRFAAVCSTAKKTGPAAEVVVALQRYSDASARTLGSLSDEERRLFDEERAYFGEICDYFADCLRSYLNENDLESLDAVSFALAELNYCQPEAPTVATIVEKTRSFFREANFCLEIDEPTLALFAGRAVDENFVVCETIRGAQARGSGRLTGEMTLELRENADKAELCLALSANVATKTTGSSRGVRVDSDNFGKVRAEKTVYWSENGLETAPSVACGSMKTRVNGIAADRPTPLGGLVVQKKVKSEIPKTERESSVRMSSRVAAQLDEEANRQIAEFNKRWSRTRNVASPENRAVRGVATTSDDERLYFSCLVGRANQLATPNAALASWLRVVDERKRLEEATARDDETLDAADEKPRSALVAKRYSGSAERVAESGPKNVSLRAHQSAPNNVAFVALAGLAFEGGDMSEALLARFPGVDPVEATTFLERYRAKKDDAPAASDDKLTYRFAQDRPFSTRFADDKIETSLRFDAFEREGREWRGLEIKFVYRIERRDDGFLFKRETIDAIPMGLDETAPIPARFQAFRSVVLNLLDGVVLDEYVVEELPIVDWETNEAIGALIPVSMSAKNGWFEAEFTYRDKTKKK
ncbi:MAG: hypothetical protein IKU86_00940 [Thermoguttaceae bacterium]|nr:hypothetical protein [Thermoguttaceae bacterium]